jgi:lipid-A-disaccharide synthase
MYPEFIQGAATPGSLSGELAACIDDPRRRERSADQAERLHTVLRQPVSGTAADWIARWLAK